MIGKIGLGIAVGYFTLFGGMMMFNPTAIDGLGLQWTNPAGKTEVRCYYGALSWSLAASLIYLWSGGLIREAVTIVLFLATAILVSRVIGSFVDASWGEDYTKSAIPIEIVFVITAVIVWFTTKPSGNTESAAG